MVSIETPVEIKLSLGNPIYRGPQGKTPVKGVDYFTQEDINDIVAQIEGGEGIDLSSYATKVYVDEAVESIEIPETDLTDYATKIYVDSAIEGVVVEETDPTVPSWAKQANKPTYTAQEVGALPANTALFSGDYNDLSNKPTLTPAPIVIQATIAGQPTVDNNGNYRIPLAITSNNMAEAYAQFQTHPSTVGISVDLSAMGRATKMYLDCESFYRYDDGNGGYIYDTYGEFNDSSLASFGFEFQNFNVCLSTQNANDSYGTVVGVATVNQLATVATSGDYNDLSNKPTIPVVPTNVSSFTNDAGYLTTHQSLTDYATKSYVETAIRGAESGLLKRSVVQALPVSDIDEDTIYMVAKTGSTGDVYDEYLYVNSNWEHIGSTDVDLTDYQKVIKIEVPNLILSSNNPDILTEEQQNIIFDIYSKFINNEPIPDIYINGQRILFYNTNPAVTNSTTLFRLYSLSYPLAKGKYQISNGISYQFFEVVINEDNTGLNSNRLYWGRFSQTANDIKLNNSIHIDGVDNRVYSNVEDTLSALAYYYASKSYVDTSMPAYLTNTDILAIWNGNNE